MEISRHGKPGDLSPGDYAPHPKSRTGPGSPIFYSVLLRAVQDCQQERAEPAQWLAFLQNQAIKREEIEWAGLSTWLERQTGPVTRQALQGYLESLDIEIPEIIRGARSGGLTAFDNYQLPGGRNYRELLMLWPMTREQVQLARLSAEAQTPECQEAESRRSVVEAAIRSLKLRGVVAPFRSRHFPQRNVLAHARFNERTGTDGKRVLFIEELQSDWHSRGRREGYGVSEIPDAPFKRTWHLLLVKRLLQYAAAHEFQRIAWTTGDQQVTRYSLLQSVDALNYHWVAGTPDGKGTLHGRRNGAEVVSCRTGPAGLAQLVGKDLASRLIPSGGTMNSINTYVSDVYLEVGGTGMHGFYDRALCGDVGRYLRRWQGRVLDSQIPIGDTTATVHGFDISDRMKVDVLRGQPRFRLARRAEIGRSAISVQQDSRDIQTLRQHLSQRFKRTIGKDDLGLASPSDEQESAAEALEEALSCRVLFVAAGDRVPSFHAVTLLGVTRTLYLNQGSRMPVAALVGHEIVHQLHAERPDLYRLLEQEVMRRCWNPRMRTIDESAREEAIADLVGEQLQRPSFWDAFHERSPSLAARLLSSAREALDRINRALRGQHLVGSLFFVESWGLTRTIAATLREYVRPAPESPTFSGP